MTEAAACRRSSRWMLLKILQYSAQVFSCKYYAAYVFLVYWVYSRLLFELPVLRDHGENDTTICLPCAISVIFFKIQCLLNLYQHWHYTDNIYFFLICNDFDYVSIFSSDQYYFFCCLWNRILSLSIMFFFVFFISTWVVFPFTQITDVFKMFLS